MGFEQQISVARRPAQLRADGELRTIAHVARCRRVADGRTVSACATSSHRNPDGRSTFFRAGILFAGPFPQILGFLCYFVSAVAETNRAPFDLAEAEQELVGGFHTEYSSMKFAMFFMAEYANMITVSCLATILFFGGWLSPFPVTGSWAWTIYIPTAVFVTRGALINLGRNPLHHVYWQACLARPWSCALRCRRLSRDAVCYSSGAGTVLVPHKGSRVPVHLCVGAWHAAAASV